MKLKELLEKLDDIQIIFVNGTNNNNDLSEEMLEKEIVKINIETKNKPKDDLESLGYSFDVGV